MRRPAARPRPSSRRWSRCAGTRPAKDKSLERAISSIITISRFVSIICSIITLLHHLLLLIIITTIILD